MQKQKHKKVSRFNKWICRTFGHAKVDMIDAIADEEVVGWRCKRCGALFSHVRGYIEAEDK